MKNREYLKNHLRLVVVISLIAIFFLIFWGTYKYNMYHRNYNMYLNSLLSAIKEKYPQVDMAEIAGLLNDDNYREEDIFKLYGIDINEYSLIHKNEILKKKYFVIELCLFTLCLASVSFVYIHYIAMKNKEIKDIGMLVSRINKGDYSLDITRTSEDEYSILYNELYKTMIMLKEQANNAKEGKSSLKNSLEDISHQLKTPLTAINIYLDNLIDNPEMADDLRDEFLKSLRRDVANITFLVESLLKLSRIDTDTVEFHNTRVLMSTLITECIKNVSALSNVRSVEIEVDYGNTEYLNVDERWQVEAITNIIKNAIEHSYANGIVAISCQDNKLYTSIDIKNHGEGIASEDLPHVFERFYRGKNATGNSVGIGLALAKSIVVKNNGSLDVRQDEDETIFTIKYYKD